MPEVFHKKNPTKLTPSQLNHDTTLNYYNLPQVHTMSMNDRAFVVTRCICRNLERADVTAPGSYFVNGQMNFIYRLNNRVWLYHCDTTEAF